MNDSTIVNTRRANIHRSTKMTFWCTGCGSRYTTWQPVASDQPKMYATCREMGHLAFLTLEEDGELHFTENQHHELLPISTTEDGLHLVEIVPMDDER